MIKCLLKIPTILTLILSVLFLVFIILLDTKVFPISNFLPSGLLVNCLAIGIISFILCILLLFVLSKLSRAFVGLILVCCVVIGALIYTAVILGNEASWGSDLKNIKDGIGSNNTLRNFKGMSSGGIDLIQNMATEYLDMWKDSECVRVPYGGLPFKCKSGSPGEVLFTAVYAKPSSGSDYAALGQCASTFSNNIRDKLARNIFCASMNSLVGILNWIYLAAFIVLLTICITAGIYTIYFVVSFVRKIIPGGEK